MRLRLHSRHFHALHLHCEFLCCAGQRRTFFFDVEREGLFAGFLAAIEIEIRPVRSKATSAAGRLQVEHGFLLFSGSVDHFYRGLLLLL